MDNDKILEKRIEIINGLIDKKIRPSEDFNDERFFGCDVCYTCKFFNIFTSECFASYEDAVKKVGPDGLDELREREYFTVPTKIKNPIYYRCLLWQEGAGL